MHDIAVKTSRSFGWLLFGGGLLLAAGLGVYEFLDSDVTTLHKLLAGALYGGLFLLFVSVLRQRLIERKTDKYKDVEK